MFIRIWNFVKRHKKKFIFTGFVCGSLYYIGELAKRKLIEYQRVEAQELIKLIRKKNHYEMSQTTCNNAITSLLPSLKDLICGSMDAEAIISQLRLKPSNSIELWNDLKFMSFTRTLSALYATTMLSTMLKVHLNIISAYLYNKHNKHDVSLDHHDNHKKNNDDEEEDEMDEMIKMRYLDEINFFFKTGLHQLMQVIHQCTTVVLNDVRLSHQVTHARLIYLINAIRRKVEMRKLNGRHDNQLVNMATFMFNLEEGRGKEVLCDKVVDSSHDNDFIHVDSSNQIDITHASDNIKCDNSVINRDGGSGYGGDVGDGVGSDGGGGDGGVGGGDCGGDDDYDECEMAYACIHHKVQEVINSPAFSNTLSCNLDKSFQFLSSRLEAHFLDNNKKSSVDGDYGDRKGNDLAESSVVMTKAVAMMDALMHRILLHPNNLLLKTLILNLEDFSSNIFNLSFDI